MADCPIMESLIDFKLILYSPPSMELVVTKEG